MNEANRIYLELIAPIEERMKRTVARIVRNPEEAADTFQNVLARVWKNLKKIHRHPNPHACILSICVNASYDTLRKRVRRIERETPMDEAPESPALSERPDAYAAGKEKERAILSAVASLPPMQAQAVFLRLVEGESFGSIAEAIGCREATARSHVSKGKAVLREKLANIL